MLAKERSNAIRQSKHIRETVKTNISSFFNRSFIGRHHRDCLSFLLALSRVKRTSASICPLYSDSTMEFVPLVRSL